MIFTKSKSKNSSNLKSLVTSIVVSSTLVGASAAIAAPPDRNYAVLKNDNMILNPLTKKMGKAGTADPTARVWPGDKNTLWLYTSSDSDVNCRIDGIGQAKGKSFRPFSGFCMPGYQVFKNDHVNLKSTGWERQGSVRLHQEDVAWAQKASAGFGSTAGMWAPDVVIADDGNYHMFFPSINKNGTQTIGVAWSKTPQGPFNARKKEIPNMKNTFDPSVIKVGNQWYMFYAAQGTVVNSKGKKEKSIWLAKTDPKFERVWDKTDLKLEPEAYLEGPHAYFVGTRLWLQWASVSAKGTSTHHGGYQIKHAPAKKNAKPLDNFNLGGGGVFVGPFPKTTESLKGTNHGSLVKYRDRWYDFYHRHLGKRTQIKVNGKLEYVQTNPNNDHEYRQVTYSQVKVSAKNQPQWFRPGRVVTTPYIGN